MTTPYIGPTLLPGTPVLCTYEDSEVWNIPGIVVEVDDDADPDLTAVGAAFTVAVYHRDHPDEGRSEMCYVPRDVRPDLDTRLGFIAAVRQLCTLENQDYRWLDTLIHNWQIDAQTDDDLAGIRKALGWTDA